MELCQVFQLDFWCDDEDVLVCLSGLEILLNVNISIVLATSSALAIIGGPLVIDYLQQFCYCYPQRQRS